MTKIGNVLVSGRFNIVHPGHLRLLRSAKELGSRLIVALESDSMAGKASHIPEKLRLEGIQSISFVDEAFIFDEPISNLIDRLRPDIVVKGREHEMRFNPESVILEKYGGQLLFSSGETAFSSLDLIRKELQQRDNVSINLPNDYLSRHEITKNRFNEILKNFALIKVLVVGDLIVDEYISCHPLGMSQEDPTIVVTPVDSTRYLGGAGIVAAHAAGLGAKVHFFTVVGDDLVRDFAKQCLTDASVNSVLIPDSSRPTTLKQRFRSKGKTLLRVSHLHQSSISVGLQDKMLAAIEKELENVDLIVFSDFNYGCLPQSLVDQIVFLAKKHGTLMAADSQSSSQVGDIGRFKGMDLITPTEIEARISSRNHEDGLVVLAEQIRKQSTSKNILLKLGEEGVLVHAENKNKNDWLTDRLSPMNNKPIDVAGAGDSMLIASAMTLACGGDIWEAAFIGSLAAAVQVSRVGNTPLRVEELLREIEK